MNLQKLKVYNLARKTRMLCAGLMLLFSPLLLYPQVTPELDIYKMIDVDATGPDSVYLIDIIKYIQDTLFFGGAKLSDPQYIGNPKGVGLFRDGQDIGFPEGLILSNGYVGTTVLLDNGTNKTGAQAMPAYDSLGPYVALPNGPPALKDADMDWLSGLFTPDDPKPDTAVDPSVITFRFKPYYNSIKLDYVFSSEEYKYQQPEFPPPPPPPVDIDFTSSDVSDFMAIFIKRYPSEQNYDMIASMIGQDGNPPWLPVCVKTLNHSVAAGYYQPNYDRSFIFDGASLPRPIFPFVSSLAEVQPCRSYWIKIAVADYPNDYVPPGYNINLSHHINSAVFLKAYSLMSGYGLEWTVESALDNPDFAGDTSLVEGGCSNMVITVKFNVMPRDTSFIRLKIGNASLSEYVITPPLVQDSLIMIPDSVMVYNFTISAVDDNINEGTNGIEKWAIRYQLDPCDVPTADTGGWGTGTSGYSGLIKTNVRDYNPYVNATKTYGPNPSSIYHCGNDITVTVSDIVEGGIPPYSYVWSHPVVPQLGTGEQFTTPISDSPDYVYATISDRCTGKPGYIAGKDTVVIYSTLEVQASPDFQLCQNGQTEIEVNSIYVGDNFTTIWYFEGNPVGYDQTYLVTWAEYGSYAPDQLVFTCVVTDDCGNTDTDEVIAQFFPVVEITGIPLICLGETIQLFCSSAQLYEWHYGSLGGPVIGGNSQTLNYTPTTAGFHTICVSIINDCGEQADTCFNFEVSQLICEMELNNSTNFSVCPNVEFSLMELNAYDGWQWSWFDDGSTHTATGQTITLSMTDAGVHDVTVTAYNIHGCYNTLIRQVTVYPYADPQAFTDLNNVCIDFPAQIGISPTGPVTISNYSWTSNPTDNSLSGQQNSASPVVTPQVTTTYKCVITDNHGCIDSASVVVNVRPRIDVSIMANPGTSCTDKPVQISFQSVVPPQSGASYYWTFDDGVPADYNYQNPPQVIWSTPGLKNITLHITEPGCEESFSMQFTVFPDPLAAFTATNASGCQPVLVSFNNASSNLENPSYQWDFGDGSTDTGTNPTHLYEIPGEYDVTLTVTNSTGCVNTLTVFDMVDVNEVPVADFTADPEAATIDNPTIRFTEGINIPFSIIDWEFGDGATNSGESSPRHTYGAPGSYIVIMYTETEDQCWDRDTLVISITEDIKIFVPNAFSPNGDGLNDCFSVGGTTGDVIEVFQVIIYSRWGQLVYDSYISDPDCVWDGKNMEGVVVTPDTYVFRIFGKNFRGAKKIFEGIVNVVE